MARILVLGGYGVFGGRLTRRLVGQMNSEILVAGRSLEKATAHCHAYGGTPLQIDRDDDISGEIARLRPIVVIDAAGPFQAYGDDPYRVAKAATAHYIRAASGRRASCRTCRENRMMGRACCESVSGRFLSSCS